MTLRVSNTISVPSGATKAPGNPSVTWNLTNIVDFEDCPFINIAKAARGFDFAGQSIDAQGNLSGLSGSGLTREFFISSMGDNGDSFGSYRNGDYTVLWDGGAGVTVSGVSTTVNSTGSGTASVTISFSGNRSIFFNNINSADPPTNIRIIKDTDVAKHNAGQIFRDEFLDLLRGKAYALRFMDWMLTNGSSIVNWSDYPTESWQRWERVPFSVMVALCNELDCHGWWCVPHQATDAFITEMATYLNANLNSGLFADIEYSNEYWNFSGAFTQTPYVHAQSLALWGTDSLSGGMSWAGRRFVQIMDLVEAVSPTRFRGILASQAAVASTQRLALDAPQWKTSDAVNYEAPHTRATFFAVADYFSYTSGADAGYMVAFDQNWDAGNIAEINEVYRAWNKAQLATTKGYIDNALANCTAVDTVDGLTRNLRFRTYEGGSNHTDANGDTDNRMYRPLAWSSGVSVLEDEVRKNQYGRLYRAAAAAGTTGSTEPTHTNGGSVSDGAVVWLDLTGSAAASTSFDVRVSSGSGTRLTSVSRPAWASATAYAENDLVLATNGVVYTVSIPGTSGATEPSHLTGRASLDGVEYTVHARYIAAWAASTSYPLNKHVQTSTGAIYRVTGAGTSGATAPTHLSGAATVDGVEYTLETQFIGDYRAEYAEWCRAAMYDGEQASCITELWNYIEDNGGESPVVFALNGRQSRFGHWGKYGGFNDTGANRTREIGDILANWSLSHPQWWTD